MTFGLLDAPFTLSVALGSVLEECQHVDTVLTKLAECGLRVNYPKCEFFKPSVKFVGLMVSGDGISPSLANVEEMVKFETPHNVASLRAFLRILGFYRRFIPLFSIKSAPLFALLKRDLKFNPISTGGGGGGCFPPPAQ